MESCQIPIAREETKGRKEQMPHIHVPTPKRKGRSNCRTSMYRLQREKEETNTIHIHVLAPKKGREANVVHR
ncbi:hypothetical protein FRX31_025707 [Thalictrum thalictroides]|uniref:Uncharacterized protein n=1 Tax=Thalictrum thalictroides TaxID=46969 RepID=A0A7J6VHW7_THATH|nr:hypothetical protein FRX31_025707 [Thalictrum thalictroides]